MTSKVTAVALDNWYSEPRGTFTIVAGDMSITGKFTPEDAERIFTIVLDIVAKRKDQLAEDMRNLETRALPSPPAIDDEIPF